MPTIPLLSPKNIAKEVLHGKLCKICSEPTHNGFNINFKMVPICEECARSIFIQQAKFYYSNVNNQPNLN